MGRTLLMLMFLAVAVLMMSVDVGNAAVLTVDDSGNANFTSIQAAIDAADNGDTIEVWSGMYVENLDVGKRLTLIGMGADVVTVQAADTEDHVFEVTADWVNISGFTVTGATGDWKAGIYLENSSTNIITNNTALDNNFGILLMYSSSGNTFVDNNALNNEYGICLSSSSNNTLTDNLVNSNNDGGIWLLDSSCNILVGNNASNNRFGIQIYSSSNNTLNENTMSGNSCNFEVSSSSLFHYKQNINTSNNVNGKPIYYWVDQQDIIIPVDAGFVGVVNSTNITVRDLILTNNRQGVIFAYTNNSKIENVNISNTYRGVNLYYSNNNTLSNNIALNNQDGISLWFSCNNTLQSNIATDNQYGIYLYNSNNNTLQDNAANSNDNAGIRLDQSSNNLLIENVMSYNIMTWMPHAWGLELLSSSDNLIYLNNFINNTNNAYPYNSTNTWNSTSPITYTYKGNTYSNYLGNFWSDYTGADNFSDPNQGQTNNDGIGNTPYPIHGNEINVDIYPLMNPWESKPISPPVHNINKGTDYNTIQTAIDDASPGNEIHVDSGTYHENVNVIKQIIMRGIDTGAGVPVVNAGGSGSAITLSADGIRLEGFMAINAGGYPNAGIYVTSSFNTLSSNNVLNNNGLGIYLLSPSNNNIISDNIISNNGDGIFLESSSFNTLSGNTVSNNDGQGILLEPSSNDNTISDNNVSYNSNHGILLGSSSNNLLSGNTASNNNGQGILLESSNGNILSANTALNNVYYGIFVHSSSNNVLYHNNLVENTAENAYDDGNNQWDSGIEGNHYSDYAGTDSDGDGIGDIPYTIPGGSSVDNYPLMTPYSPILPPTIQDKSLLQVEGQPEVYWHQNNKLYWVTDWDVINQMAAIPGWDSVNVLPVSEFNPAAYEQGGRFISIAAISDGLLIQEQAHPEVYLISGGKKHHIISEEVFLSMGYSFDDVIDVSPVIIGMFPFGSDIGVPHSVGVVVVDGIKSPGEWSEDWRLATDPKDLITTLGMPSGMDLKNLYYFYDVSTDYLYLMSEVYGIPGDLDGNGDIGSLTLYGDSLGSSGPAGTGIGYDEMFLVSISQGTNYVRIALSNNDWITSGIPYNNVQIAYGVINGCYEISIEDFSSYFSKSDDIQVEIVAGGTMDMLPEDSIKAFVYAPHPAINIEISTNGLDADSPTGPVLEMGDTVTWKYVVTNIGANSLSNIAVTDDKIGDIVLAKTSLEPGESTTGTATSTVTASGQYSNMATVVGYFMGITVTSNDPSHYFAIPDIDTGFTVGQGASPATEQLFKNAYNRNGGVSVLGEPESDVHEAFGLYPVQNFPGVPGIPGGVLMYNSIQNNVSYLHGAIWERYYIFQDKAELGPVKEDEKDAAPSQQGTTGRYSKFENGTIHWISDENNNNFEHPQRGESFVTYGDLDALYTTMGGTYSDLGFPVMDQEERDGHGFCEFEMGSLVWDKNEYKIVSVSSNFMKNGHLSNVFTTGDQKHSMLTSKGNGFTVQMYASVVLPDNTLKYAYSDDWPFCIVLPEGQQCTPNPLMLSDTKRPLFEEPIQLEDGEDIVWNAYDMTGNEPSGEYEWKIWYEDINNPGDILASSTASYTVSYSRSELMRLLIQDETKNEFTVNVDGQEYNVATLNHYINPVTLELSETNNEVKVYLDMDENPVSDGEISRKIGVVDYINKLQKNGLKDQLDQKQEIALIRMVYAGNLPFVDWVVDTIETIIQLPTKVIKELINSLIEESAAFVYDNIFNNKEELNDKAIENFLEANNNYFNAWNEIRNDADVLDYEKANVVLDNYLMGDFNFGMGQYILDNYYVPKGDPLIFGMREAAKIASLGTTEEIIAAAISVEYVSVSYNNHGITQCDISKKPYEFTSYTLQLAQSSPILNEYENCILKINEETEQIKQDVSDVFTQQITLGILNSPGELRIYDSQNRVTGLIDGQIIEEIPNSEYVSEDETVIIYDAVGTYRYEVEGTDFGTYGLDIISLNNWDTIFAFNAFDIPTTPNQNHQYNIDWEMLLDNQNGVSIQIDSDGDGIFEQTIITNNIFRIYNLTFLPPITTMEQFSLTSGSTLPIKFTVKNRITDEFIYDDTVNVTITNSTGHLITYFTNGTGTDSVRINPDEEQYIVNFHTKNYDLTVGETYAITVTFGESDSLRGYDMTYFTLLEGGKSKGKMK